MSQLFSNSYQMSLPPFGHLYVEVARSVQFRIYMWFKMLGFGTFGYLNIYNMIISNKNLLATTLNLTQVMKE